MGVWNVIVELGDNEITLARGIRRLRRENEGLKRVLRKAKSFNFNSEPWANSREVLSNISVDKSTLHVVSNNKIDEKK